MGTIQRSLTLLGQNELRGTITLPSNKDPSTIWHTLGGGCVPPEPCRTIPAQFRNQGLAAALSPGVLQPFFLRILQSLTHWLEIFKRKCLMRTHSLVALFNFANFRMDAMKKVS